MYKFAYIFDVLTMFPGVECKRLASEYKHVGLSNGEDTEESNWWIQDAKVRDTSDPDHLFLIIFGTEHSENGRRKEYPLLYETLVPFGVLVFTHALLKPYFLSSMLHLKIHSEQNNFALISWMMRIWQPSVRVMSTISGYVLDAKVDDKGPRMRGEIKIFSSPPEERQRRLLEIPDVHADPNMNPSYDFLKKIPGESNKKKPCDHARPRKSSAARNGAVLNSSMEKWNVLKKRYVHNIVNVDRESTNMVHERVSESLQTQGGVQTVLNSQNDSKELGNFYRFND
ncbi:hypothetical protein NC652_018307 [Populus alba x Populus x berolinensis]|nr:hypothetical protein NC652_018307 [Populus alba x Populus x berolinensis]